MKTYIQDSDIELKPDYIWYMPAKSFDVYAFTTKVNKANSLKEPRSYTEALASDEATEWISAMEGEVQQPMDKRSWNLVLFSL
jgi:hypothetical protein